MILNLKVITNFQFYQLFASVCKEHFSWGNITKL